MSVDVMLVDGAPGSRHIVPGTFRTRTCDVRLHVVADAAGALRCLRQEPPDADVPRPRLIMIHLAMPGRSGYDLIDTVKRDPDFGTIPVVVLASCGIGAEVGRCYDMQANCCIRAPDGSDAFADVVRRVAEYWIDCVQLPPTPAKRFPALALAHS